MSELRLCQVAPCREHKVAARERHRLLAAIQAQPAAAVLIRCWSALRTDQRDDPIRSPDK